MKEAEEGKKPVQIQRGKCRVRCLCQGQPSTHRMRSFTRQFPSSSAKALEMETCRPLLGTREICERGNWKLQSFNLK